MREIALDDTSLIAAVRAGDDAALAALYDRYSGIVYSVALRVLADTSAAEDVLQETFLRLWRNPASFDSGRGSMAAWLAVAARNRADQLRRRHPEEDAADLPLVCSVDLAEAAARRDAIAKARTHLAAMPPEQRRAVELAFFEGLTHSEIAARTGEPLGTVKTRIRSGVQSLRRALTQ